MKKLVSCLLTASMTVMMLPVQAHTETLTDNILIYQYDENTDCYLITGVEDKTITSVTIPAEYHGASVKVESNIFADCPNLTEINVEKENTYHTSIDGVLLDSQQNLIAYPCNKPDIAYTVPNTVQALEIRSFQNCANLVSVTFSDSVKAETGHIFENCPNLEEINGIITVSGTYAVQNCHNIRYLHFSGGIHTNLPPFEKLEKVEFEPDNPLIKVTVSNPELKELILPVKCKTIQIADCQKIEKIRLLNSSLDDAQNTIEITNCPNLKEIIIDSREGYSSYSMLKLTGLSSLESVIYYEPQSYESERQSRLEALEEHSLEEVSVPKLISSIFCGNYTVYGWQENDILRLFCEKYNHPFEALDDTAVYETGDVTGDTKIDILDVVTINKAVLGKENLTSEQVKAIDFNGDGKPDASDSLTLMKYIVGLIETLV